MLSQDRRLHKKRDIELLMRGGRSVFHTLVTVKFRPSTEKTAPSRFVFVVSTKVDKRSTYRNRLRRRVQAIVQHISIAPGYAIAIFIKAEAKKASFSDMTKSVVTCLQNAKLVI